MIISNNNHKDRFNDLRNRLDEKNIDSYYTDNLLNIRYLTGFKGTSGGLLIEKQGTPTLLVDGRYRNYAEQLNNKIFNIELHENSRIAKLNEIISESNINSVHFERSQLTYGQFLTIKNEVKATETRHYGEDWVTEFRTRKDESELDSMRIAINQTLEVFDLIESWLEPGISEISLSRSIRRELESRSEGLAFDPLVLIGENTANPHSPSSEKELSEDDVLLVDQGMKIDGYCSDLTRMFFVGNPDSTYRDLYELSQEATVKAFQSIEAGISVEEVTEEAHSLIEKEGYEKNLRHGLGHGVGLNVHEPPALSTKRDSNLTEGMVVTLEPGIYIDGFGGARIEHMAKVEENGATLLDEPNSYLKEAM